MEGKDIKFEHGSPAMHLHDNITHTNNQKDTYSIYDKDIDIHLTHENFINMKINTFALFLYRLLRILPFVFLILIIFYLYHNK